MLIKLATILLVAHHGVLCLPQDEPYFYPTKHPDYKGPEWDHYPLDPEPYPLNHRQPTDGIWPFAHMQHQWKIDSLTFKHQTDKVAASFNIYRSAWQICVNEITPVLWQPCGWQLDKQYLKCSSDMSKPTNGWYTCDDHLYTRGGNTTIEKEIQWIKWRFEDTDSTSTPSSTQIKFVHAVPMVPCIASMPGYLPAGLACSPPYVSTLSGTYFRH